MTIKLILILTVIVLGVGIFVCMSLCWNCQDRINWIEAKLEDLLQHVDAMQEAQMSDWESYGRLEDRIEALERRHDDDGK